VEAERQLADKTNGQDDGEIMSPAASGHGRRACDFLPLPLVSARPPHPPLRSFRWKNQKRRRYRSITLRLFSDAKRRHWSICRRALRHGRGIYRFFGIFNLRPPRDFNNPYALLKLYFWTSTASTTKRIHYGEPL